MTNPTKVERLQTHFQALSTAATSLNTASDELTKAVGVLDEALKKLNVGLTAWVSFISWSCEAAEYDNEQVGYAKVNGKWGIAIHRIWGDSALGEEREEGPWLFNDAPREMRIRAVDKIPEMVEALSAEASKTTKRVLEKTKEVRELADAIGSIVSEKKVKSVTLAERILAEQNALADAVHNGVIAMSSKLGRDAKERGK